MSDLTESEVIEAVTPKRFWSIDPTHRYETQIRPSLLSGGRDDVWAALKSAYCIYGRCLHFAEIERPEVDEDGYIWKDHKTAADEELTIINLIIRDFGDEISRRAQYVAAQKAAV